VLTYNSFLMSRFFRGGRPRLLGGVAARIGARIVTGLALSVMLVVMLVVMLFLGGPVLGLAGCASGDDVTKPITYSLTAKQNYEKGLA